MAGVTRGSFEAPDETRSPEKTTVEEVVLGSTKAARVRFEPGWKWSECIKPVVGTESCQMHHVGTIISGQIHVAHSDGSEADLGPGDVYVIEPGHDAWVVGGEPCIGLEFDSRAADSFAR